MSTSFWSLLTKNDYNQFVIPVIQRDYAHGRSEERATSIREEFLNSLGDALTGKKPRLSVDFIYGASAGEQIELIDGQQRFTTLFLLHWYLAGRVGADDSVFQVLSKFSYRARTSSQEFCNKICENHKKVMEVFQNIQEHPISEIIRREDWFVNDWMKDESIHSYLEEIDKEAIEEVGKLHTTLTLSQISSSVKTIIKREETESNTEEKEFKLFREKMHENRDRNVNSWVKSWEHPFSYIIEDAKWYLREWKNDPTVCALLNMLDSLARHKTINKDRSAGWSKLTSEKAPIVFEFLPVDSFGNSEDLYVKMNSRGKALTSFENFKALFGKHLEELKFQDLYKKYWLNIDGNWSTCFWDFIRNRYREKGINQAEYYYIIDDTILKYIWVQVEMYSVYFYQTRESQPDFYKGEKPKLAFEMISNPKGEHKEDWENKTVRGKKPEELIIQSLEESQTIFELIDSMLGGEKGVTVWNDSLTTDRLFPLEKVNGNKLETVKGTGGDDYSIRILAFVIIYWCSAFGVPDDNQKKNLCNYLRVIRNCLQRYRSKKSGQRIWDPELDKKVYGRVVAFILDRILDVERDSAAKMSELLDEQIDGFNHFKAEAKKCNLISTVSEQLKEDCFKLEDSDILQGTILPLFNCDKLVISSDEFSELFSDVSLKKTAKALMACGDLHTYFAIPSGEKYNNRIRLAFCDEKRQAWSIALLYTQDDFSKRNVEILARLVEHRRRGESLEEVVNMCITKCEGESEYHWQYYFLKYWDSVFETKDTYIAGRKLLEWPTFELREDWYACRTSYIVSRFSEDNTCNVFIIMAATEWLHQKGLCMNNKVFNGGKKAQIDKEGRAISLSYDSALRRFVVESEDNTFEYVECNDRRNIVQDIVAKLNRI